MDEQISLPHEELLTISDSADQLSPVLAEALRRRVEEIVRPTDAISAGFDSLI